ncbi:molybdopterin molybdotransferase MoeA [Bacteriovoracaceae bacterium]|nr:molybdopterin molybdotransferase MoeA [Bacteriovoracaceae bacterium]
MISVDAAELAVKNSVRSVLYPLAINSIDLGDSIDHFLACNIFADREQPPFDRVAMDGIAINEASIENKQFKIAGIQAAGAQKLTLESLDECLEVMTGAILPKNTHIVIPYERITISGEVATLNIKNNSLKIKQNVHLKGSDYKEGQLLLSKNKKIKSPDIAVLASVGMSKVDVYRLPAVAVISTGDELVEVDQTPLEHQIRKSNSCALKAELICCGFKQVDTFHLIDNEEQLAREIESILSKYPLVLLSGGVSMGKFDFVPKVLDQLGVNKIFHKVCQRPGKPLWFGQNQQRNVVMGLPGNPVSCLVSLRRYIIEALFQDYSISETAILNESITFKKEMTMFCPVTLTSSYGHAVATPIKMNGSGDFYSLAKSDGFLEFDAEKEKFVKGENYKLYRWGRF